MEEGVDGVRELLVDPRRIGIGGAADGVVFWADGLEPVRDDGKEDSEGRRLEAEEEPLVEGR